MIEEKVEIEEKKKDKKKEPPKNAKQTSFKEPKKPKTETIYKPLEGWEPPIFIIKPECQSQGRGIYLTKTGENIDHMEHVVA